MLEHSFFSNAIHLHNGKNIQAPASMNFYGKHDWTTDRILHDSISLGNTSNDATIIGTLFDLFYPSLFVTDRGQHHISMTGYKGGRHPKLICEQCWKLISYVIFSLTNTEL